MHVKITTVVSTFQKTSHWGMFFVWRKPIGAMYEFKNKLYILTLVHQDQSWGFGGNCAHKLSHTPCWVGRHSDTAILASDRFYISRLLIMWRKRTECRFGGGRGFTLFHSRPLLRLWWILRSQALTPPLPAELEGTQAQLYWHQTESTYPGHS
jgi:hypothetical protein